MLPLTCDVCVLIAVVPHITDAIQEWVERVAKVPVDGDSSEPEVCIIEVKQQPTSILTDLHHFGSSCSPF